MPLLIQLLVLVCVLGIVYWVVTVVPLPPPLKIVAQVLFAIVAIWMLLGIGGWTHGWRLLLR